MRTKKFRAFILATLFAITLFASLPFSASAAENPDNGEWRVSKGSWYYYKNGAVQTGWVKDGNTWYYLKPNGAMATGWLRDGNTRYYLKPNGAMATGWVKVGNAWYYLKPNGAMATGWLQDGNAWYYLKSDGAMASDVCIKIGGKTYCFDSSGAWIPDGSSDNNGNGFAFPYQFNAKDLYGNSVSNSTLGNKEVFFVHLWATWCGPCINEMSDLANLAKTYGDKVGFIGLLTDYGSNLEGAKEIARKAGIPDSFIMVDAYNSSVSDIAALLQSGYVPTTVLISKDGAGSQIIGAHGKNYSSYIKNYLK